MTNPLIDIIIAVYNGAQYITEALDSIQTQTLSNLNIIVVDDGSEDNTYDIVAKLAKSDHRITIYRQQHKGVSAALNFGLAKADAIYTAFLDADDLWHPEKLEKQLNALKASHANFCFCLLQEFDDNGNTDKENLFKARTQPMKGYSKTTFLGYRSNFEKYGTFNEAIAIGDFIEWLGRAIRAGENFLMVEEVLTFRRIHGSNSTRAVNKNAYLQILKAHLGQMHKPD